MKLSSLHKNTGLSLTKLRRHAQEILGPDITALRRSGYHRDITLREGWKLYLSIHLITVLTDFNRVRAFLTNYGDNYYSHTARNPKTDEKVGWDGQKWAKCSPIVLKGGAITVSIDIYKLCRKYNALMGD